MIEIREESPSAETIAEYCEVPMSFLVSSRYQAQPKVNGGWDLREVPAEEPFLKDYDNDDNPQEWATRFDVSRWTIFSAFESDRRVGGTILAFSTPGVDMLEGRADLAVIWDIRVRPELRGKRIGSLLFEKAISWARQHGCREIKVETQDINVRASDFYARMGCELRIVREGAYPTLPAETQYLWFREL